MKARLIYPRFERFLEAYPEFGGIPPIAGLWKYRMPPALGLRILAAMMPDDVEWDVTDANVDPIDFDEDVDLVGISFFTPQAGSAYEIADVYRARGVKVVLGGMHPSMIPDDAEPHADAVCVGEAEGVWPRIIEDARRGELKRRYGPARPPPEQWVRPLRGLFHRPDRYDWPASLVQVARGCPRACPYCNLPDLQGHDLRFRPIDDVVDEVRGLDGREFYITEDVIMFRAKNVERYTTELFERMADLDVGVFLTSSPIFNVRPPFLDTLAAGGTQCLYVTFGFDPISEAIYRGEPRMIERGKRMVESIQERGIRFFGAFGVGFDQDDPGVFDRILSFCEDTGIVTAEFFVATPFPNTPMWHQMRAEERLLTTRWSRYNCAHVVHRPNRMTEQQLVDGFLRLWTEFYADVDVDRSLSCFNVRPNMPG